MQSGPLPVAPFVSLLEAGPLQVAGDRRPGGEIAFADLDEHGVTSRPVSIQQAPVQERGVAATPAGLRQRLPCPELATPSLISIEPVATGTSSGPSAAV